MLKTTAITTFAVALVAVMIMNSAALAGLPPNGVQAASLKTWLDASDINGDGVADVGRVQGDPSGNWADKSGLTYGANTIGDDPTYLAAGAGGTGELFPAVRFTPGSDRLIFNSPDFGNSMAGFDATVIMLINRRTHDHMFGGDTNTFAWRFDSDNNHSAFSQSGIASNGSADQSSTGTWQVLGGRMTSAGSHYYFGTTPDSGNGSNTLPGNFTGWQGGNMWLGGRNNTHMIDADLAQLAVWNTELTEAEYLEVADYMLNLAVPEPSSFGLLALGLVGLLGGGWRRRRQK